MADDDIDSLIEHLDSVITHKPSKSTSSLNTFNTSSRTNTSSSSFLSTTSSSSFSSLARPPSHHKSISASIPSSSSRPTSSSSSSSSSSVKKPHSSEPRDELDDLLSNLDDIVSHDPVAVKKAAGSRSEGKKITTDDNILNSKRSGKAKCFPVYLSANDAPQCCRSLICLSCDLPIVKFDSCCWSVEVDYMFLRNNYPAKDKLLPMMKKTNGSRAYCCQCSWITINGTALKNLEGTNLKWRCMGH